MKKSKTIRGREGSILMGMLFGILQIIGVKMVAEDGIAWYDDESRVAHVATYKNERLAARAAEDLAKKGWMPQANLFTTNHSDGAVTISYVRTSEWYAKCRQISNEIRSSGTS